MTLHAAAPERELYEDDEGRRSIPEAIDFAVRLVPTLRRNLDHHDLIVASVFPYFPVLASKLTALGTETPLITTWHEVWGDYWEDYLGRLALGGKLTEHATARLPQHPIAVSGVTADRLAEIGPNREEITVVPNGIDVSKVQTTEPAPDGFDVLFAGRLIEDKHVDQLITAFDRIADNHPDATLGIVGDGPQRSALEQQANTTTHADRITFLGFLDDYADVLAHMRAADVFASPSTREGFGITYVEAMAADCTVIGVDHPDSAASEVIDDAGVLTQPTVPALTDSLVRALSGVRPATDPQERATRYDWNTIADDAAKTYRAALESQ